MYFEITYLIEWNVNNVVDFFRIYVPSSECLSFLTYNDKKTILTTILKCHRNSFLISVFLYLWILYLFFSSKFIPWDMIFSSSFHCSSDLPCLRSRSCNGCLFLEFEIKLLSELQILLGLCGICPITPIKKVLHWKIGQFETNYTFPLTNSDEKTLIVRFSSLLTHLSFEEASSKIFFLVRTELLY